MFQPTLLPPSLLVESTQDSIPEASKSEREEAFSMGRRDVVAELSFTAHQHVAY
jgi:hypothetical protein